MKNPSILQLGAELESLGQQVIGAAIEVHRALGPEFLESAYQKALSVELSLRGIDHCCEHLIRVTYKGVEVGEGRVDVLVPNRLLVELKAVDHLTADHEAQVVAYLRAAKLRLGFLLNFNHAVLKDGLKRIIL